MPFEEGAGEQVPPHHAPMGTIRFRLGKVFMLTSHKEDTVTTRRDNCGDYYAVLQISSDRLLKPEDGISVGRHEPYGPLYEQ